MSNKPKVHLVRMTPEDHDKLVEMAESNLRSVPNELHLIVEQAYNNYKNN